MVKKASAPHKERGTPKHGKGKQPKNFLNQDAALDLAAVIAEAQEEKTLSKATKNHQLQAGHPHGVDQKSKLSGSKMKLKETKALLAAQRAHHKREKTKLKKQRERTSNEAASKSELIIISEGSRTRKKVSFA
ncbi:hypothetical protein H2248_008871 [Termitomyces sp. 'cryptogamus']|nr:hypothetical protein H2248_008871 [Termitomyces sp. 'cryptogamus']